MMSDVFHRPSHFGPGPSGRAFSDLSDSDPEVYGSAGKPYTPNRNPVVTKRKLHTDVLAGTEGITRAEIQTGTKQQ